MNLFKLVGKIIIENTEANNAIDGTTDKAQAAESKLKTSFDKFGQLAVAAGKAISAGLAAGATAISMLTKEALKLSGSVEQGLGGAEAVFGDFAKKVESNAKAAFSSMGLSMGEYLETANKMGSLFVGTGSSVQSAYNMTTNAMQRAADVASVMGIDIKWAMESVAGMAKGNFTMMDNLGVAMNETTLEAYALSKGLEVTWKELDIGTKTQIAYEMFMERTAYAMGRYTEENNTYTGSLNTASAAIKNWLSGQMDMEEALPHIENAINVAVDRIVQLLPVIVDGLTKLMDALAPHIPDIMSSLLPVLIDGATQLLIGVIRNLPEILKGLADTLGEVWQIIQEAIFGKTSNEPIIGSVTLPSIDATTDEIMAFLKQIDPEVFAEVGIELPDSTATHGEILDWWAQVRPTLPIDAMINLVGGASIYTTENGNTYSGASGSYATGLDFVPRDNFIARLHQGEAVLTAREAGEWRRNGNTGNLEKAVAQLTQAVAELQEGFQANMNLYVNKKHVASALSRDMGRSIGNREYMLLQGMGG